MSGSEVEPGGNGRVEGGERETVKRQRATGQTPFTGRQSSMGKLEAQLRGVQRHAMKGGAFRGAARAIYWGLARGERKRSAGNVNQWFMPGEPV